MGDFKKCPNGHYYQGDVCPYCDRPHNDNNESISFGFSPSPGSKVCPNHHAYYSGSSCPYCGEDKVIGSVDMHTGEGYHIIVRGAGQIIKITINEKEYSFYDLKIGYWVWEWANRVKSNYCIEIDPHSHPIVGGEDCVFINCHDEIVIGQTKMTGKEFIKMCDVIIDNQLAIVGI